MKKILKMFVKKKRLKSEILKNYDNKIQIIRK